MLQLHLRDLSRVMVEAWRREFAGLESVTITQGDIFSDKPGTILPGDPITVTADAIVSPANSFGYMNGGIDAVYTHVLGPRTQEALQALLRDEHHGELPVGQAVIVASGCAALPWCVSAPTMRTPCDVSQTLNAFLAMRAALRAVLAHNAAGLPRITTVLCPGLATAIGGMPVERCARQMRVAWERVVLGHAFHPQRLREAEADGEALLR